MWSGGLTARGWVGGPGRGGRQEAEEGQEGGEEEREAGKEHCGDWLQGLLGQCTLSGYDWQGEE